METCASDGNLGFPITISGNVAAGEQIFNAIQGNPELIPSFATRTMPRRVIRQSQNETGETQRNIIDESNLNTILYRGKRFSLHHIQICAPTSGGSWPNTPKGTNAANAAFIYSRPDREIGPQVIILMVPLYEKESMENLALQSPKATMYFEDARNEGSMQPPRVTNVGQLFAELANPGYVSYITCVPLRSTVTKMTTLNVFSAFFPAGWILPKSLIENIGEYNYRGRSRYAPFFFPEAVRYSYPTASTEPPPSPATTWIENSEHWSDKGQTFSNTISVSSAQFTTRFLWISAGLSASLADTGDSVKRLKTTLEYQCMPLDRVKDIQGKYVLLDPSTGERTLKDALEGGERKAEIEMAIKQGNSIKTFAIVIGVIAGLLVGVLGLSFAVRYIIKRPEAAQAAAAAATAAVPIVT